jgi:hypothetical protein
VAVVGLEITGTPVTVRVRLAVLVPALFVALSVTVETPAALGVPEIKPDAELTKRPEGRPDAPKLVGKLLAVIW